MNQQEVKNRIEKLKALINHHRYLRHVLDKQEITESALDSLKKELFDLEQKYPRFITPDSPTQRVAGTVLEKFNKIRHTKPMLSLNDGFSKQDMFDWQNRIMKLLTEKEAASLNYFVEPKIDGLAVCLIYENGLLKQGATRGDGQIGEDVSENLKTIESIPLKLEKPISCEVRGEVYIKKNDFKKLNQEQKAKGLAVFANPRNLAAGSTRQLDPKVAGSRRLSFLAWQLFGQETQVIEYNELKALGFKPVEGVFCQNLEAVFRHFEALKKQRQALGYEIDGLVVSVNNNRLFRKLGVAGKAPRAAIAFKFPGKEKTTIVKDILVQVGRTGAITPVAILEPVELSGAIVSRATLHNEDEIKRLGLKIGDTVIIERAGDVIPKITRVLKELRQGSAKDFKMPKVCPICKTKFFREPDKAIWKCPNQKCETRRARQLYHFASKHAFDIEGLGPKVMGQLLEAGLVSTAADLFLLKPGDLLALERFAEKSSQNLAQSVENSKKISLPRFLLALGISGVGEETALDLAEQFQSLNNLQKASREQLLAVKDIGPKTAQSINDFFQDKINQKLVADLLKAGVKITNGKKLITNNQKLKGRTFVLTGTLESLTRDEAKAKIRALGGDVSGTVSSKTDFVIAGKDPGSKYKKASQLGVKILTEPEFLQLIA